MIRMVNNIFNSIRLLFLFGGLPTGLIIRIIVRFVFTYAPKCSFEFDLPIASFHAFAPSFKNSLKYIPWVYQYYLKIRLHFWEKKPVQGLTIVYAIILTFCFR